jgi:MFS superfamily sulfate permease-like transporter
MLVPQGLTYAVLANLPPVHGLYVAFFPLLVYTLLGSSRHLSVGPEVTSAILIGKAIMQFPGIPSGDISDPLVSEALVEASIALTFTVGVMSLLLGLTRLGFLDSILSRPMLAGFVNAVALTLICEQLPTLLGMTTSCGSACAPGTSPFDIFIHVITHMGQTHWQTLMVALCCCTFMFGAQAVKGRFPHLRAVVCFPDVLVVVVAATFVSWAADLPSKGVVVFGHLTAGFRKPQLPSFQHVDASQLITSALTISLLGFVESMLISKKYASKHAYGE